MVFPFARHASERGRGHPDGFELRIERFGIAYRLLSSYAFVRPESEQNSSHPTFRALRNPRRKHVNIVPRNVPYANGQPEPTP
jgi:hypothetical protein